MKTTVVKFTFDDSVDSDRLQEAIDAAMDIFDKVCGEHDPNEPCVLQAGSAMTFPHKDNEYVDCNVVDLDEEE